MDDTQHVSAANYAIDAQTSDRSHDDSCAIAQGEKQTHNHCSTCGGQRQTQRQQTHHYHPSLEIPIRDLAVTIHINTGCKLRADGDCGGDAYGQHGGGKSG